jgi:hypothetical protein
MGNVLCTCVGTCAGDSLDLGGPPIFHSKEPLRVFSRRVRRRPDVPRRKLGLSHVPFLVLSVPFSSLQRADPPRVTSRADQSSVQVIEQFGKYKRMAQPGFNWCVVCVVCVVSGQGAR